MLKTELLFGMLIKTTLCNFFLLSFTLKMSFVTTGAASGYASNNMSNAQTSAHVQVYHPNPNKSVYQNSNSRYTQSAQFYVVSDFDSNNGYLGQSVSWEYDRTADLGGTPFLLLTLPGLANVVHMDDASSSGAAACEIVHPDIFEHYRVALRAGSSNANDGPAGRVISEADPTFQWYATDGTGITDTNANFMHFYEGQPYWTPNVGYHCQNTATVKIGGTPIHIQAGMRQAAWAEINAQPGKRLGAMVGGSDLGSVRLNKHLEFKRRSMRMQFLCVPLLVSFAHNPAGYLPLPAMQFHKIYIEYSLRAASKLICNGSQLPSGAGQYNSMGATSRVAAVLDGSISSDASLASPFDTASVMESSAATVYTITRYGEDTEANHKSKRGDMIALVNDASWGLTSAAVVSGTA